MPRGDPVERLDQLVDAAAKVFRGRGYRRTQMSDVAREMGVSQGTLYNYVESKEALFDLAVRRGLCNPSEVPDRFPVPTPAAGATLAGVRELLGEGLARMPALEAACERTRVTDPRGELEAIVRELYRTLARNANGINLLERSAVEWPELAEAFYVETRQRYLARLAGYLEKRMARKQLRPVANPGAAARLINETCAWFALHRAGDPDPGSFDEAAAEETVVDSLVHAFAPTG